MSELTEKKWGGVRRRPDGRIVNGGAGKPRVSDPKEDPIACRPPSDVLERFEAYRMAVNSSVKSRVLLELMIMGLDYSDAIKGLEPLLASAQRENESRSELLRRLLTKALDQLD